jgi:hypothetical protein
MKNFHWVTIVAAVLLLGVGIWYLQGHSVLSARPGSEAFETSSTPNSAADVNPCVADGKISTIVGPQKSLLYLMCFQLSSSTVQFGSPNALSGFGDDGQFQGGQFEVIVQPSAFPIAAPEACKGIILRMPWTLYSQSDAQADIAAKKALFDQLSNLKAKHTGHVNVVVQLNPYVTVVQASPLKLRLSECNIFFRDVAGKYSPSLN